MKLRRTKNVPIFGATLYVSITIIVIFLSSVFSLYGVAFIRWKQLLTRTWCRVVYQWKIRFTRPSWRRWRSAFEIPSPCTRCSSIIQGGRSGADSGEARGFAVGGGGRDGGPERIPRRRPRHSATSVVRGGALVPEIFFIGSVHISWVALEESGGFNPPRLRVEGRARSPTFTSGWTGSAVSRRTANKKLTELYWPPRKHSEKRLVVLVERQKLRGTTKENFCSGALRRTCAPPPILKFVTAPLGAPISRPKYVSPGPPPNSREIGSTKSDLNLHVHSL